ncbi:MAG: hypothetical protein WA918_06415 [Erythrobacter sp.]
MSDTLRRIQLLEDLDPFAVNCGIKKRCEPHGTSNLRPFAHRFVKPVMADQSELAIACRDDVMVQSLQRESMQIDEIARNVKADDKSATVLLDGSKDEPVHQDCTDGSELRSFHHDLPIREDPLLLYEFLDVALVVPVKMLPQPPAQEIAGGWKIIKVGSIELVCSSHIANLNATIRLNANDMCYQQAPGVLPHKGPYGNPGLQAPKTASLTFDLRGFGRSRGR